MAEPVLDTSIHEGQTGALDNWDALNLWHNDWIVPDGSRMHLPGDFSKRTEVFVDDYGAVGDGVTDDTASIMAAFATLGTNGGRLRFSDNKNYLTATGLAFRDKPVLLMGGWGRGQDVSSGAMLRCSTQIVSSFNGPIVLISETSKVGSIESRGAGIMQLGVLGSGAGSSQVGIAIDNRGATVMHCEVANCGSDGIQLRDDVSGYYANVRSHRNKRHGWLLDLSLGSGTGSAVANSYFAAIEGTYNDGTGFRVHSGTWNPKMNGATFEGNKNWGLMFVGLPVAAGTRFARFRDIHDEQNKRTDAGCSITNGVSTVLDTNAITDDIGKTVKGTGIVFGAKITNATPGVSFELVPAPTSTGTVTLDLCGSVRFNDANTTDNKVRFNRFSSGKPSYYDSARRNLADGVDLDETGLRQRQYMQVFDLVSGGPLDPSDIDAIRMLAFLQDTDAVVRGAKFVATFPETSGAGVRTTNIPVPTGYAFNMANGRSLGALQPDDVTPYELIASGSDGTVQISPNGYLIRCFAAVDMSASGGTGYMIVPKLTQTQRLALSSPADGTIVYQTDNTPNFYKRVSGAWATF